MSGGILPEGHQGVRRVPCCEAGIRPRRIQMNRGHARRPGPRLTLTIAQMMKLVVFGAAASVWLLPMKSLVEEGFARWPAILLWEAIAIPLAQAVVAFALVKPGRFRDGLILALVGISLAFALGAAVYLYAWGG